MDQSRETYKYKLKLARQRVVKGEIKLREMEAFMAKCDEKIRLLQSQIVSLNKTANEYVTSTPKQSEYVQKQRSKVEVLERILRLDREMDDLRKKKGRTAGTHGK